MAYVRTVVATGFPESGKRKFLFLDSIQNQGKRRLKLPKKTALGSLQLCLKIIDFMFWLLVKLADVRSVINHLNIKQLCKLKYKRTSMFLVMQKAQEAMETGLSIFAAR
jgi:hypothetical protein